MVMVWLTIYSHGNFTYRSTGHGMMPVEFTSSVHVMVEVLHLWNVFLEFCWQGDSHTFTCACPRARIQDLYVDVLYKPKQQEMLTFQFKTLYITPYRC